MAGIPTKKAISLINTDNRVLKVNSHSQDDALCEKSNSCHLLCQITILAHTHAAVLVSCRGGGLMATETHGNVFERRGSMNRRGVIDILPGNLFYVYIINMTTKPLTLPKLMIVA